MLLNNKTLFLFFRVAETVLSLSIPLLVGFLTELSVLLKFLVGVLGVLVALLANVITLWKFQEKWIEYRTVAESLKRELFLYQTKSGTYNRGADFNDFV